MDDINRTIEDLKNRIAQLETQSVSTEQQAEMHALRGTIEDLQHRIADAAAPKACTDAWERTLLARHEQRPYTLDIIALIFQEFTEIHGDRRYRDDPAMIAGFAIFEGRPVAVVGQQKGRNMKQRVFRNYGMPKPEGYRKALRLMKLADKFSLPILCFVDTPGAYPGIGAEERGQAEAIAYNLREMAKLRVPVIVTILGEGGSGGALAIGVGDRILMLENAVYSVISPESCSAILWKDQLHAREAANALKLAATDLLELKLIDEIVPEPDGGAHSNHEEMAATLAGRLRFHLAEIEKAGVEQRIQGRYDKFRAMGS